MKKITLTPKAKKITIIASAAAVCIGVLSFVLLQHADAKSENLSTVSYTASSAVNPSASFAASSSASSSGSASSAISGTSSGTASGSANSTTAAAKQTGTANNGKATVRASSNNGGSGTTTSPKGSGSAGNKSTETAPAAPAKHSGGTPTPAPKAPDAPAVTPYNISADQQAVIAYGRSKGLTYNSNLRPENTTWSGRADLLLDVGSDSDIIRGGKDDIDGMLRAGYAGDDFYPYFEKKSNKTNDYYFYVLWG